MRFKVQKTPQGDTFVKMARSDDFDRRHLRAEHRNTTQAANSRHPIYGRIAPRVLDFSDDAIYLEYLSGYRDALSLLVHEDGSLPNGAFTRIQELGAILAYIHGWEPSDESRTEFPSSLPLDLDRYLKMNPLVLSLLGRLQQQTHMAINNLNDRLAASGTRRCHIHGDFKPDNILLSESSVRVIDWELAGSGHPEHDFASFYAGIFTELVYCAANRSSEKETARNQQLSTAALSALRCTKQLIAAYRDADGKELDIDVLTQLIGAKLLVRTAVNNYLSVGNSPFATLIQQSAEHCLNNPTALSRLLASPYPKEVTDAKL